MDTLRQLRQTQKKGLDKSIYWLYKSVILLTWEALTVLTPGYFQGIIVIINHPTTYAFQHEEFIQRSPISPVALLRNDGEQGAASVSHHTSAHCDLFQRFIEDIRKWNYLTIKLLPHELFFINMWEKKNNNSLYRRGFCSLRWSLAHAEINAVLGKEDNFVFYLFLLIRL